MNAVFVLDGKLVSPSLGDTVLNGVTRNSVLNLGRQLGIEVEERRIAVAELKAAAESGALSEAFGGHSRHDDAHRGHRIPRRRCGIA